MYDFYQAPQSCWPRAQEVEAESWFLPGWCTENSTRTVTHSMAAGSPMAVSATNKPETPNPQQLSSTGTISGFCFEQRMQPSIYHCLQPSAPSCHSPKWKHWNRRHTASNPMKEEHPSEVFIYCKKNCTGLGALQQFCSLWLSFICSKVFLHQRKTAVGWVWVLITASLRSFDTIMA